MNRPYFSIVLPIYNVAEYLSRCIESILKQKKRDFELILVDDGSTDNSGYICDQYEMQFDFIKAYHKENGGLSDARNYGMDRANGEYIVFIDSDDWVDENLTDYLFCKLQKSHADIIRYAYKSVINGEYSDVKKSWFKEGVYNRNEIENELLPATVGPIELFNYSKDVLNSAWINAYRLTFLTENNIRFVSERIILNEDYLFIINVMLFANIAEITHKELYYYDYREGSLSKSFIYDEFNRKLNFHKAISELIEERSYWKELETSYYSQVVDGFYACFVNECSKKNPDKNNAKRNIKKILSSQECRTALEKCNHSNMGLKGKIIYFLMKKRLSSLMYYLYLVNH